MPASAFISYCRDDSDFALRLAQDLRAAGAGVWIDQLDIPPGDTWDDAIEQALEAATYMLLVLSPASAKSKNVRNEIAYALDRGKIIIPVVYQDCIVPLQLQRNNRIDFRADYAHGLAALLAHLQVKQPNQAILNQAAEDDARRQTAWQAREAEAKRLSDLEEQERRKQAEQTSRQAGITLELGAAEHRAREAAALRQRQEVEREAAETDRRSREETERKTQAESPGTFPNEEAKHSYPDCYAEDSQSQSTRTAATHVLAIAAAMVGMVLTGQARIWFVQTVANGMLYSRFLWWESLALTSMLLSFLILGLFWSTLDGFLAATGYVLLLEAVRAAGWHSWDIFSLWPIVFLPLATFLTSSISRRLVRKINNLISSLVACAAAAMPWLICLYLFGSQHKWDDIGPQLATAPVAVIGGALLYAVLAYQGPRLRRATAVARHVLNWLGGAPES